MLTKDQYDKIQEGKAHIYTQVNLGYFKDIPSQWSKDIAKIYQDIFGGPLPCTKCGITIKNTILQLHKQVLEYEQAQPKVIEVVTPAITEDITPIITPTKTPIHENKNRNHSRKS